MPKDPKQRMQEYHDIIKVHPYRQDFAREFAGDYNFLMYDDFGEIVKEVKKVDRNYFECCYSGYNTFSVIFISIIC